MSECDREALIMRRHGRKRKERKRKRMCESDVIFRSQNWSASKKIWETMIFDIRTAVNHNEFLPVLSICATCFGRVDHSQALQYVIPKPKNALYFRVLRSYILNMIYDMI